MNILLVEDKGTASYYLREALDAECYNVFVAFNVNDAQSYWDLRENAPIHAIILDLNLPTVGLTPDENACSAGGKLAGWVWLKRIKSDDASLLQRTIIISEYIKELRANVPESEYRPIPLVPKKRDSSSVAMVLDFVANLAVMKQKRPHWKLRT